MKGCHPDYINLYGRGREYIYQVIIPGDKRSGTTRNINPEARKKMDKELVSKGNFLSIFLSFIVSLYGIINYMLLKGYIILKVYSIFLLFNALKYNININLSNFFLQAF